MPYNYILDKNIRRRFNIDFSDSIIIFDEAHNMPSSAEEAFSFSISTETLEDSLSKVKLVKSWFESKK